MLQLLRKLAGAANLKAKISEMFAGQHLNVTEDRAVLHPALRAPRDEVNIQQHDKNKLMSQHAPALTC